MHASLSPLGKTNPSLQDTVFPLTFIQHTLESPFQVICCPESSQLDICKNIQTFCPLEKFVSVFASLGLPVASIGALHLSPPFFYLLLPLDQP